jgi:3'(2'), 5'-bisphosphate nucleotidase
MSRPHSAEPSLPKIISLAVEAGEAIMGIYSQKDFAITYKAEDSPLTFADMSAHNLILYGLKKLTPDLPVLSEESKTISYDERQQWSTIGWLILWMVQKNS